MPSDITIDATGKPMGRLASQVATLLQGKQWATHERHIFNAPKITVLNASKVLFTGKKLRQKVYRHHTGYIGHLKEEKMKEVFKKDPGEVLRRAVTGMLPKNKLRAKRLKQLFIKP